MKVKVSNPRGGSVDYVSQALKLSIPAYTKDMLVELPSDTASRWVEQLKKDGLGVVEVANTPPPPPPPPKPAPTMTSTTSPKSEPAKETSTSKESGSKTSTSKK